MNCDQPAKVIKEKIEARKLRAKIERAVTQNILEELEEDERPKRPITYFGTGPIADASCEGNVVRFESAGAEVRADRAVPGGGATIPEINCEREATEVAVEGVRDGKAKEADEAGQTSPVLKDNFFF